MGINSSRYVKTGVNGGHILRGELSYLLDPFFSSCCQSPTTHAVGVSGTDRKVAPELMVHNGDCTTSSGENFTGFST